MPRCCAWQLPVKTLCLVTGLSALTFDWTKYLSGRYEKNVGVFLLEVILKECK